MSETIDSLPDVVWPQRRDFTTPVREVRTVLDDAGPGYVNRILIATPTTGQIRMEWALSRYGQTIPVNWSFVNVCEFMSGYVPLRYQVDDAQNVCVRHAIEGDFEWLLLWEHDVVAPPDAILRLNYYMLRKDIPIVSGLYFTRGRPSTPLIFRGRGNGPYLDWEMGDAVWADGVPTGFLLIHNSVLRVMWEDSEEYNARNQTTRRVFNTPRDQYIDPEGREFNNQAGTSDLAWCTRIMEEDVLRRAGWEDFADEHPDWPFLVDTNIFCRHINPNGEQFP